MSNVATPKVYQSGFKYIAGMALDAATWSKNYFDMLEHMNPKPKSVFWIVQDNLVTKAVHETNMQYAEKAGLKTVGTEGFAGTTQNFSGIDPEDQGGAARHHLHLVVRCGFGAAAAADAPAPGQGHGRASHHGERFAGPAGRPRGRHRRDLLARRYQAGRTPSLRAPSSRPPTSRSSTISGPMGRMDSYLVMMQAIERAGAVDREKVAAELHKPGATWKRAGGEFKFNEGGLSQIVSYTHQMQKGEPVVVWPKEQATGKMIWPSPSWQ